MSLLTRMDSLIAHIDDISSEIAMDDDIKHQKEKPKPQSGQYRIEIKDATKYIGKSVELCGWVQQIRKLKKVWFIELRDGTQGIHLPRLQCILERDLIKTEAAKELSQEVSIKIYGKLIPRKQKGSDQRTVEIIAESFEIIGQSPLDYKLKMDGIKQYDIKSQLDQRHLMIRQDRFSIMLRLRYHIIKAFRDYFDEKGFIEITPPTIVQTQAEGGSTLFKLKYFEQDSYLTQTSQLYLESCCPALGKVYSIMPSYRAETSRTRRHLAEYTHIEAEMPFIKFEDLLDILEDIIVSISETLIKKHGDLIKYARKLQAEHWPKDSEEKKEKDEEIDDFVIPKRPFKQMTHEEAIAFCRKHDIRKIKKRKDGTKMLDDDGKEIMVPLEIGDDIPEGPERRMTDMIGEPILLKKFPAEIKSFYMSRCSDDGGRQDLTQSVDLLMPGVGEIIGGSMRESDQSKLLKGYEKSDIKDITQYYWYQDLRKYGTFPHGGFGLGLERFVCWMLRIYHIRDSCLYPRFIQRCTP